MFLVFNSKLPLYENELRREFMAEYFRIFFFILGVKGNEKVWEKVMLSHNFVS